MEIKRRQRTTPRDVVIRAVERRDPAYVPAWYNFFADETFDQHGQRLRDLLVNYNDDIAFAVLSTFPAMADMPQGWTDEWACSWMHSPNGVGAVSVDSPIYHSWQGLSDYLEVGLPGLGQRTDLLDRVSRALKANEDRYLVATTWLGVFERMRALRGSTNVLLDLYEHPRELEILRDAIVQEFLGQIEGIGAQGADAVLIADDFGTQRNLLISPEHWRRFFKASYGRLAESAHNSDLHFWFHSCGNIEALVPDLIELGVDVLHPLQPSAMDLVAISEAYSGDICFAGAVDVQGLLPVAEPHEIVVAIEQLIDLLDGPQGGYVVAPTNSIMPDTPLRNIEAMCRTMRDYGHAKRAGR